MSAQRIPFLDLNSQHLELQEQFVDAFRDIVRSGSFSGGEQIAEFENSFALYCGSRFCIGVGSGTDALRFALIAAGVKGGDLVLTVPNTFIATTEAISQAGATAHFIDVDEHTSNMSVIKLGEYLEQNCFSDDVTGETIHISTGKPLRAIVPVHLYGQTADMDPIVQLARRYGLLVVEDACQAHGSSYFSQEKRGWLRAGALSKAAAFSFYPGKNLGAFGEAGAITTNDPELAQRARMLRDHGQIKKYFHELEGYNGRMDTIQAAVLNIKLKYLETWNEARRSHAQSFNTLGQISGLIIPAVPSWAIPNFHLYVIRVSRRDMLQGFLGERGISTGLHYPVPLHQQKAYRALGYTTGSFPVSELLSREILSLPMYPSLSESQKSRVVEGIAEFFRLYPVN